MKVNIRAKEKDFLKKVSKLILTTTAIFSISNAQAQTREEYEEYVRKQREKYNQSVQQQRESYDKYVLKTIEEYKAYEAKVQAEYEAYTKKVKAKWGDKEDVQSTDKKWVEYNEDLTERSIVDFEDGTVRVEVLIDDEATSKSIDDKLVESINNLIKSKGKTTNYESEYIAKEPISQKPILEGLIDLDKIKEAKDPVIAAAIAASKKTPAKTQPVKEPVKAQPAKTQPAKEPVKPQPAKEPIKEKVKEYVEQAKQVIETRYNDKGKEVKVASVKLDLVDGYVPKRASEFGSIITKYSNKYSIKEPLIYAIIEQESSFNPSAISNDPSYGLMQIVPTTGGRDAYNYVYKKDNIPSPSFLYNPDNNIHIGTAYLSILKTRSFAKITDPDCQMLCMIAAYNCGAGNVSRAIIGNTNLPKAIPHINEMSYDKLYSKFSTSLPKTTQDYVHRVTRNMKKYSGGK